ncbi:MAG: hypothetical protein J1F60_04365 [Oscillospiraceae bacterium]|nr:hypothetical protein [Oscillospiraceae bacterium]
MKEEKLFNIVNDIDDDLICEMLEYSPDKETKGGEYEGATYSAPEKARKVRYWQYPAAVAALMLILVGALFIFNSNNTLPYEQQPGGTTANGVDPALSPLELINCQLCEDGKYRVNEKDFIVTDDYDLFRQYFFGTWEGSFCFAESYERDSLVIDDSLKSFNMIGLEPWYDGVFYKVNDSVLAFMCGGSAGGSMLWLDMNAPGTMYVSWGTVGNYETNWFYSRDKEGRPVNIPVLYTLKKSDIPPNKPEENFLSIFRLREISRDHGIDFSLLTDLKFDHRDYEDGESYRLSHNAYALFYPVYLVSQIPDRFEFKTVVGNGHDEYILAEVSYAVEKIDGKWVRTQAFLSSIDNAMETHALELLHCHLSNDGEYRVDEGALTVMDDYDLFRRYFFGTWKGRTSAQALIIDDSLNCYNITERPNIWCSGEFYRIGDSTLAFVMGGSGGPEVFWLDMNDPETMYAAYGCIGTGEPQFDYIWSINGAAMPQVSSLEKSDVPPNDPEENFLSIFRLREISRDHGIDFALLVEMTFGYEDENGMYCVLAHNANAMFYPVYLVSESPDKLEFRTTVGSGWPEDKGFEARYTVERINGEWVRTEAMWYGADGKPAKVTVAGKYDSRLLTDFDYSGLLELTSSFPEGAGDFIDGKYSEFKELYRKAFALERCLIGVQPLPISNSQGGLLLMVYDEELGYHLPYVLAGCSDESFYGALTEVFTDDMIDSLIAARSASIYMYAGAVWYHDGFGFGSDISRIHDEYSFKLTEGAFDITHTTYHTTEELGWETDYSPDLKNKYETREHHYIFVKTEDGWRCSRFDTVW